MKMIPVNSSDLASVGYEFGKLYIHFHSGGTYVYFDVPIFIYENLMGASSHGKYFHSHIKNAYRYQRIS